MNSKRNLPMMSGIGLHYSLKHFYAQQPIILTVPLVLRKPIVTPNDDDDDDENKLDLVSMAVIFIFTAGLFYTIGKNSFGALRAKGPFPKFKFDIPKYPDHYFENYLQHI